LFWSSDRQLRKEYMLGAPPGLNCISQKESNL
jgi:hypothetical protein